MPKCYIGAGSNIGDRMGYIEKAIEELKRNDSIKFLRASSIYETEAVGYKDQPKFLNGVFEIETSLTPKGLLDALNAIEKKLGRVRIFRNAPRTIDLDILFYGDRRIKEEGLVVPHPRIEEREFVLKGLRELTPHLLKKGKRGEEGAG